MLHHSVSKASDHKSLARGFTIIELLVTIVIISILAALLLPAIQQAREMARRSTCINHVRQLAIAVHAYHESNEAFPISAAIPAAGFSGNDESWSVHGRLLPHIEQGNLYEKVDLTKSWTQQPVIDGLKIPLFGCPSDPRSFQGRSEPGEPTIFPVNYAFNYGTWLVIDPATGDVGDGVFVPNTRRTMRQIDDGTTTTLMIAEVKTWTPYFRNVGPADTNVPDTPDDVLAEATAPGGEKQLDPTDISKSTGHTEWADGRVHQTGFTTVLTPNKKVIYSETIDDQQIDFDIDYTSWQEGKQSPGTPPVYSTPTYAAITSRSFHTGIVNVAMCDGSVKSIQDGVDRDIWRALGTITKQPGEPIVGDNSF